MILFGRITWQALKAARVVCVWIVGIGIAVGQTQLSDRQPYVLSSPRFDGKVGSGYSLAFTGKVEINGSSSLRIYFKELALGEKSYLRLTSRRDKLSQQLDSRKALQWQNSSMYFNGDVIEVELFVAKNDIGVHFEIAEVEFGRSASGKSDPMDLCGGDNRVPSAHPAVARVVTRANTSTAWISSRNVIVSAGHVVRFLTNQNTIEFNVPFSAPNGWIIHPGEEDQYTVDQSSKNYRDEGYGSDWGTFSVFPNSQTGLLPAEKQNSFFVVAQNNGGSLLRVTGYGEDDYILNKVQQSQLGTNQGSSGQILHYSTDTQEANSGSPVIDESTGYAVGVHTHGRCLELGYNIGTSMFNLDFWNALHPGIPVTVFQKLSDNTQVGTISKWEGTSFGTRFGSGQPPLFAPLFNMLVLHGDTAIYSNQKYKWWIKGSTVQTDDIRNHHGFYVDDAFPSSLTSQLGSTDGTVKINADLLEMSGTAGDVVKFRDPWYIDANDANYANNRYNQGMANAVLYERQAGPNGFHPDYAGSYPQGPYRGVFLNQSGPPNWNPPYYSVDAPPTQTIGGFPSVFLSWSGTNVAFQTPNNATTGVVFQQPNATATALYKLHLRSSLSNATATTNQRKLIHVLGSYTRPDAYHLTYQSHGDVWYTRSLNGGATWSAEILVSRGTGTARNPSIAEPRYYGDDTTYVVWLDAEVSGGQTKYSVFFRKISLVTGQLTAIEKVEFGGAQYWARPNATPVAVRLGAMPNYPDVTVAFEAEGAGIIAAHRYYYGSNGIIWWATQLQGTTTSSAHPSMAISFDYTPYNVSIAYDDGGLIYFATSDVAHQTPVIFGSPEKIGSGQFSGNQYPSLAVSPVNEKYVSWIALDWWYTGSGWAVVQKWDASNGWSRTSSFIDDLGNPEYLTSSMCTHDFFGGATMFWCDRSVLANMTSPDGFNWTMASLEGSSTSIDHPNLAALAPDPYSIASVLTKNNQSPFEVKFQMRNNGSFFGHPLAKGSGLDSLESITRTYRLVELRDSISEEKIVALFGEIRLLSQGGEVLRKIPFTEPTSANNVLRSVTFNLGSSRAIELEFGLAERNWLRHITFAVDLVDSASGRVIEKIHSRRGRGIGHPGFRGRIQKNISRLSTSEPVYLVLRFSGDGLERYEQFMTNLVQVKSGREGMFKQSGDAVTQSSKPTIYSVHNNYPNPFNPSTKINYDLPEPANVSLILYDVLGRKVTELVNSTKEAGYHSATWNASEVASGVYFARFTATDGSGNVKLSKVKKLLLAK